MKPLNHPERRKQILTFGIYFTLLLLFVFVCGILTLVTARKGISLLEEKKDRYERVFRKQAEISFQLKGIYKNLYSLKNKRRNMGEHKQMQKLITDARVLIEQEIDSTAGGKSEYYKLYLELLNQVKDFQGIMGVYEKEQDKRRHNIEQLEKCKEKYQELSKQKIK
ncbi:type VI secretion system TssO [Tenacibaculum maritimum]|uniref:Putative membrane protein n=1 Tax=Tenacibaculum maritimum NCIMB 2154 TaxID=1349785 RepID=A0A2H1E7E7_9FLAO|nr:type VI secretion system TssO [Tenacibaculum maritimum]MCD9582892.1 type VI secretion system TssO [Tenacibaculum maritimum]MCD9637095.1 type VI secretion system TssO [Tenacibaculum maritimum]QCD61514.1 hypothetical protein B9C57_02660 [Tenacibaculum maritimum]CAA0157001.1 putative membrane protein [Tenacibaculum maritimum]CAA0163428.1 putative membrane protein [Tenacibaculum maritimum]